MTTINTTALGKQTQNLLKNIRQKDFFEDHTHYDLLLSCVIDHNHLYYLDNDPIISDYEYDQLFDALKKFESLYPEYINKDSPTQQLIEQYDIQTEFQKSNHWVPILSLQNTYNAQDILDRSKSIATMLSKKIPYTQQEIQEKFLFDIEPKYDGLWVVLSYEYGRLVKAVTRGDGYTGDDVTANTMTIQNLPKILEDHTHIETIIVRGEVMISKSTLQHLNTEREQNGEQVFSNTRNAAAWSLKLLDTNEVAKRWLMCYVYDVLYGPREILTYFDHVSLTNQKTNKISLDSILSLVKDNWIKKTIDTADLDFDGLVIKLSQSEYRDLLWSTNHHPRRSIAYKFPAQQASAQILDVDRQVWRTWILTPVAQLTPTLLSWATISRVSLHNIDFIQSKDIRKKDRVWIQRSWKVIPYVVAVIFDRRDWSESLLSKEDVSCPACWTPSQAISNIVGTKSNPISTTQLICPNPDCVGILQEQLKHFVSKQAMNIASIGDATLELLISQWLLKNISDIYTLHTPEKIFNLKRFPWIGEKKVEKFIEEIEESKNQPLRRIINAVGIPWVGIKLAKEIEKHLMTWPHSPTKLEEIFQLIISTPFLEHIHGIGEKTRSDLWVRYQNHSNMIQHLQHHGVRGVYAHNPKDPFTKKQTIAITGTFPITRSKLQYYIEEAGFDYQSSITQKTNYLLVWKNPWEKAKKIGAKTTVLKDYKEIYNILGISEPLFDSEETSSWWAMQSLF